MPSWRSNSWCLSKVSISNWLKETTSKSSNKKSKKECIKTYSKKWRDRLLRKSPNFRIWLQASGRNYLKIRHFQGILILWEILKVELLNGADLPLKKYLSKETSAPMMSGKVASAIAILSVLSESWENNGSLKHWARVKKRENLKIRNGQTKKEHIW